MSCEARENEQGFLLVGLVVAIFIILLFLAVAAPTVAHELRREQEVETVYRGNQYVRAIQLYYRKFGHYPGSMEQLEKTSEIRFLRKQYVDPMTGKADWRLIKVGEAKTTVKGFFGKPLTGLAPGLGSAAGMASGGGIGAGAAGTSGAAGSAFGSSGTGSVFGGTSSPGSSGSAFGDTSSSPTSGLGSSGSASSGPGTSTAGGSSGSDSSGFGSNSGMGSQSATSFTGGGAPFEGVGLVKDGDSIVTLNEQTTYKTWEFIYDPRIEQLKAAAALQGGGANGTGVGAGSSFGSGSSSSFGSGSSSGFGNSSGSAFGNSSGTSSGFGSSSPTSSSPTSSGSGSSSPQ
jgi:type II secretory pathway pseudopilin PulG